MKAIDGIAYYQGRRDEQPNVALAERLVRSKDRAGIREIAAGLHDPEPKIAGDCIKVLSTIGERAPELIASFVEDFISLLASPHNRLVWGAMSALTFVAALKPREVFAARETVLKAFRHGSVITMDAGVSVLASLCRADARYAKEIWPVIREHLATCRPKELPQHAERAAVCVNGKNRGEFVALLEKRLSHLSATQKKRVEKVLKAIQALPGR